MPRDCPKYAAGVGEGRSQVSPTHLNHPLWSRRKKKQKAQHTGTRERCCLPPARTLQLPLLETLASCVCVKPLQSCRTVCDPVNCSPPGSSVHESLQVRILEWVARLFSGDLPDPGIKPASLMSPALAGRFVTTRATWELSRASTNR